MLLSQYGSEAEPAYSLRHPDPASPESKNRYAVALYDSYNPDILFGEVLLIPEWTQSTLSQEEIRKNGGVPPAPQPILPTSFIIQLYNPDQQVLVHQSVSKWSGTPQWVFEMPQQSFRQPSISTLDRTQSDPTASETTPKLSFRWKKDGKLSKDYVCSLSGKSTNPDGSKRKNREPDITLSIFKILREITMYEPNLARVEMEDPKGLEVVLLLSAVVIREVYNGHMKDSFNISDTPRRPSVETPLRKTSSGHTEKKRHDVLQSQVSSDPNQRLPLQEQNPNPRPPPTDPRSQWEIDAETARLKKQVEREARERKRAENAETKRLKRMVEEENRKARQQQAEIDKETERLRREYEKELQQSQRFSKPPLPLRTAAPSNPNFGYAQAPIQRPHSTSPWFGAPNSRPVMSAGPYLQPPGNNASSSVFFGGPSSNGQSKPTRVGPKPSFFKLRGHSDQGQRLTKKQSAVF